LYELSDDAKWLDMMKEILVLGAGSAGLLAALAVRRTMPQVGVRIVRSPEIGVVGVGESTTPNVPRFLFDYLKISRRHFFELAEPTWKLGIHFLWGPRKSYNYTFEFQMDVRHGGLLRPNGYYCDDEMTNISLPSSLMAEGKAFPRHAAATPNMEVGHAFHLENAKFVKTLEFIAQHAGVTFIDGTIRGAERAGEGVSKVILEDGRELAADFFIDASGFRRELIAKVLQEPFINFDRSLFNDRAILGSWERTSEPILPYTTAETMNSGWSWQIDHERVINRGYVYSSTHITDEEARAEFALKNPRAKINDRIVRFNTGRHERSWVGNVLAVGNAMGFVEPLEATAIMLIVWQCQTFADLVQYVGPTPGIRALFNKLNSAHWDDLRDFLTLHFKTNTRLDTPYWRRCREQADASGLQDVLGFYQEAGPTGFNRYNLRNAESHFGIDGYLMQLVGNKVPHRNPHLPTDAELQFLRQVYRRNCEAAGNGMTVEECLALVRHPRWRWFDEQSRGTKVR
jgi:tryptophan halogenase